MIYLFFVPLSRKKVGWSLLTIPFQSTWRSCEDRETTKKQQQQKEKQQFKKQTPFLLLVSLLHQTGNIILQSASYILNYFIHQSTQNVIIPLHCSQKCSKRHYSITLLTKVFKTPLSHYFIYKGFKTSSSHYIIHQCSKRHYSIILLTKVFKTSSSYYITHQSVQNAIISLFYSPKCSKQHYPFSNDGN